MLTTRRLTGLHAIASVPLPALLPSLTDLPHIARAKVARNALHLQVVVEQPLAARRLHLASRMSWHDPLQDHPRYQRLRVLGQGAQSTVVLALERATGQKVAIKLISRGEEQLTRRGL